jgi:hypothetical protein
MQLLVCEYIDVLCDTVALFCMQAYARTFVTIKHSARLDSTDRPPNCDVTSAVCG